MHLRSLLFSKAELKCASSIAAICFQLVHGSSTLTFLRGEMNLTCSVSSHAPNITGAIASEVRMQQERHQRRPLHRFRMIIRSFRLRGPSLLLKRTAPFIGRASFSILKLKNLGLSQVRMWHSQSNGRLICLRKVVELILLVNLLRSLWKMLVLGILHLRPRRHLGSLVNDQLGADHLICLCAEMREVYLNLVSTTRILM